MMNEQNTDTTVLTMRNQSDRCNFDACVIKALADVDVLAPTVTD
jgi:hypothetical protein